MAVKATPTKTKVTAKSTSKAKPAAQAKAAPVAKAPVKAAAKPPAANTVTLKHLAAAITDQHNLEKRQAETIVTGLIEMIVDHLKAGDRVKITGLGIISVRDSAARMGRNPATGEAIQIKASRKIAFRASKELKSVI